LKREERGDPALLSYESRGRKGGGDGRKRRGERLCLPFPREKEKRKGGENALERKKRGGGGNSLSFYHVEKEKRDAANVRREKERGGKIARTLLSFYLRYLNLQGRGSRRKEKKGGDAHI